jgi:hypothetical protein
MGSLSSLYISQSYQSLAHLGTNNALVAGQMTQLQDGLGNSLNINFDGTNISSSGNIYAANLNALTASALITASATSNVITFTKGNGSTFNVTVADLTDLSSLNAFTSSQNTKNATLASYTGSNDTKWSNLGAQSGSWITESETGSFVTTSSFNQYTSSNDSKVNQLINATGSYAISSSVAAVDAAQQSQINSLIAASGSYLTSSVPLTSLNAFTASQDTKNSTLATYTASVDSSLTNLNTFTASNGNTSLNSYTASNDTKWNTLGGQTGSYVTSAITASSLVTASVNLNTITFTKGDASTFTITVNTGSAATTDLTSLNAFTASQETKDTTLENVTSSLQAFTSSQANLNTTFATTGSNNFVGNQRITGSLIISSSAAVDLQVTGAIGTTGNIISSGSNGQVQMSNVAISVTSNTQTSSAVYGRNVMTQRSGSNVVGMAANPEQGNYIAGLTNPSIFTLSGSWDTDGVYYAPIQFQKGLEYTDGRVTFTRPLVLEQSLTASLTEGYVWAGGAGNITTLVATSSFGGGTSDLTSLNSFTASQYVSNSFFATTGSNTFRGDQIIQNPSGNTSLTLVGTTQNTVQFSSENSFFQASGNFSFNNSGISGGSGSLVFTATSNSIQLGADNGIIIARTSGGGPASTGASILVNHSGSLVLSNSTANPTTLGHISSSVANANTNLIFKTSTVTADTIVSGSNNIFTNPAAPTAGFKRFMTTGNIIGSTNAPQISGSMAFPVTVSNNTINGQGTITMRGPVSSSAWTINNNLIPAQASINIGSSGANNAEKLISGLGVTSNIVGQAMSIIANKAPISESVSIFANTIALGTATFVPASSSLSVTGNLMGGVSITNSAEPVSNLAANVSNKAGISANLMGGVSNTIIFSGSANGDGSLANNKTLNYNQILGYGNAIGLVASGLNEVTGATQLNATMIAGNQLIITGSDKGTAGTNTPNVAGGAHFGRYNANDSRRNTSGENIFSVGTGTSTSNRKTGFLIDSGSNTFVEGTLNVSGSTTISGSTIFTGSISMVDRSGYTQNIYLGLDALGAGGAGAQPLAVSNINAIAIGPGAMRYASGSTNMVAIGGQALSSASADGNIAIGFLSMQNTTTGRGNVAIGLDTLKANTTGNFNFALGGGALVLNTTGADNVAIGSSALNGNISGQRNIAIGSGAGIRASGSNNILIGNYGGSDISGSFNVVIGAYSGTAGEVIDNNIIICDGSGGTVRAQYDGDWQFKDNVNITGSLTIQSGSSFFANGNKQFNVGAFQSSINQSGSANVSQSMNFETTDISQGVSIVSNSQITLANSGTYNIQFSAQILADTGADDVYIWLKKNGTNVSASAGHVVLANNEELIAAWNYVVDAVANDYYEIAWQSTNGDALLLAENASGNIPSIPSIILTVTQVR